MSDAATVASEEFHSLCEFFYRRTGMVFTEAKRYYVERRVRERMSATGARPSPAISPACAATRWARSSNWSTRSPSTKLISIARNISFKCLTNDLLAERLPASGAVTANGDPRSGRCPVRPERSLIRSPMWLLENWPPVDAYDIEIIGSDIDTSVLEAARRR